MGRDERSGREGAGWREGEALHARRGGTRAPWARARGAGRPRAPERRDESLQRASLMTTLKPSPQRILREPRLRHHRHTISHSWIPFPAYLKSRTKPVTTPDPPIEFNACTKFLTCPW